MLRKNFLARPDYDKTNQEIGFTYHSDLTKDGLPYWTEGVGYEFTLDEIEQIEEVTKELHDMCINLADEIAQSGDYPKEYQLSDLSKELIEGSWRCYDKPIYGRFDFYVGDRGIKLYEYNADTPTSLLEASVAQWKWLSETDGIPHRDQFNSIHEKLIEGWKIDKPQTLHVFASNEAGAEDWGNVEYMADVASQGGWNVYIEAIENISWDGQYFIDSKGVIIEHAFKLYPWEWMVKDKFGKHLLTASTTWFEPVWKMLLSNKALLPVLWERYPNHPNLLPSYFKEVDGYIKKPILGREGSNIHRLGQLMEGSVQIPEYDTNYIWQEFCPLPEFNGRYPVVGSWIIGAEPAGIGIREDKTLISGNGSHFVPHYFI